MDHHCACLESACLLIFTHVIVSRQDLGSIFQAATSARSSGDMKGMTALAGTCSCIERLRHITSDDDEAPPLCWTGEPKPRPTRWSACSARPLSPRPSPACSTPEGASPHRRPESLPHRSRMAGRTDLGWDHCRARITAAPSSDDSISSPVDHSSPTPSPSPSPPHHAVG